MTSKGTLEFIDQDLGIFEAHLSELGWAMDHFFWTEVSVCHSSLCGLA
jgi:hypothetical protein